MFSPRRAGRGHRSRTNERRCGSALLLAALGECEVERRGATRADRVDAVPPWRRASVVLVHRGCGRWPVLRPARREAVRSRPRVRLPSVLWFSLRESMREPARSEHPSSPQTSASGSAAGQVSSSPFPNKPPRMHRRSYGRLFNKGVAVQERWITLHRDFMRRHYPGVFRDEDVVGVRSSWLLISRSRVRIPTGSPRKPIS
jgi:hypothetical protein